MSEEQLRQMNARIEQVNKLLEVAELLINPNTSYTYFKDRERWNLEYQEYLKTYKMK